MKITGLSKLNRVFMTVAAAVCLTICMSFASQAAEIQDSGKKISFLSGLNAWDAGSLTAGESRFLKYIVSIVDSGADTTIDEASASEVIGAGSTKSEWNSVMRKGMDVALNCLCGNAYYNQVASGITMKTYYETDGSGKVTDNSRVAKVETVMNQASVQALASANERYKAAVNKLSGLLVSEAGITADDSQLTALTKINNWLVAGFTYDEGCFNYTVEQTLDQRRGVCGQYSQIIKYSCDYLGIACDLVADGSMVHAWNRVYIDGSPYYIDVTWNITNNNPNGWFLKTPEEFAVDHTV